MKMKRNKKRNKIKNYNFKFFAVFTMTLSLVLLVGLGGMLAYQYLGGEQSEDRPGELAGLNQESVTVPAAETDERPGLSDALLNDEPYGDILSDSAYMTANRIYARETAVPGEVSICFAGDILFDDAYAVMATAIQKGGAVGQGFSAALLERMQAADIMMLNNEFPYTDGGTPVMDKQYTFRAAPETAAWLKDMGVDIVSLANNHAFDFGEIGLADSLATLNEAGMPFVGAGANLEEAAAPVYFIAGGLKIAFVAATQIERLDNPDTRGATETESGVFRCWNPQKLLEVVTEAAENSDFVVVYIHWGTENELNPDWAQLDQAPQIAAAGADLIIGAHPHCLQGITYSNEVPVIYSLGNFWFSSREVDTGMIEAVIDANGLKTVRFIPALQKNCRTDLLDGAEKERVLQFMREQSPGVMIDEEGFVAPA